MTKAASNAVATVDAHGDHHRDHVFGTRGWAGAEDS